MHAGMFLGSASRAGVERSPVMSCSSLASQHGEAKIGDLGSSRTTAKAKLICLAAVLACPVGCLWFLIKGMSYFYQKTTISLLFLTAELRIKGT